MFLSYFPSKNAGFCNIQTPTQSYLNNTAAFPQVFQYVCHQQMNDALVRKKAYRFFRLFHRIFPSQTME